MTVMILIQIVTLTARIVMMIIVIANNKDDCH